MIDNIFNLTFTNIKIWYVKIVVVLPLVVAIFYCIQSILCDL